LAQAKTAQTEIEDIGARRKPEDATAKTGNEERG